jgi:hypothetical protein
VNDYGSPEAIRATAERLRRAARALEPGVLEALDEVEHPSGFRSIAADLLDQTLHFLDELVAIWGTSGLQPPRYNRTYEAALRHTVRHCPHVGDLAELARTELRQQRARLEPGSSIRPVLILACTNAISGVRITAAALASLTSRLELLSARESTR